MLRNGQNYGPILSHGQRLMVNLDGQGLGGKKKNSIGREGTRGSREEVYGCTSEGTQCMKNVFVSSECLPKGIHCRGASQ